jgi:hypothetical protein
MIPKVLIFTAIYDKKDYSMSKFLACARKINYPNFRHIFIDNSEDLEYFTKLKRQGLDVYHVQRGNNTRESLARAQEFARILASNEDYDYILSIESDIYVTPDVVQTLLFHAKDVVSAWYEIGTKEIRVPCITIAYFDEKIGAYGTRLLKPDEFKEYTNNGLKVVQAAGMGCCLIYKSVFLRFPFTYDERFTGHSDIYFFNDCFNNKIPVFVDTDLRFEHENSDWSKVERL